VNKELLDTLAAKFTEYKYDFKKLVKDICTSRTYQLSTKTNPTNESDDRNFSHAKLRRVRSEVLLDMITAVTGTRNKFAGLPLGARAVQIADGNTSTYFLTTFGRASRATVCSCEVKMEPNLSQALHLLNGETVQQKIQQGNLIKQWMDGGKTPEQIIDLMYISALTRRPTDKEKAGILELLQAEKDPKAALEDTSSITSGSNPGDRLSDFRKISVVAMLPQSQRDVAGSRELFCFDRWLVGLAGYF
jgi:hypothetical protein